MSSNLPQRIVRPGRTDDPTKMASAIRCGEWLYISGQGPLDLKTMKYVPGTIEEETAMTMRYIEELVVAAGGTKANIVKCVTYLADLADFPGYHAEFTRFFETNLPARTTVGAPLLRGIRIEIDAVAYFPEKA